MKSIWEDEKKINNKFLFGSKIIDTEILIIGGGITGVTLAYMLKDQKHDVTLIDKSIIGYGATSKSTAKISYLQGIIYQTLKNKFNLDVAKKYFDSQKEAIEIITNIIAKEKINCDLKKVDSIIFTMNNKGISKIKKEKEILENWKIKTSDVNNKNIISGIKVDDTYVFNPLKYINTLVNKIKSKVNIYQNVLAQKITLKSNQYLITTNKGIIKTKKIVVTTHYPFFIKPSFIPLKSYIKREYVNASKLNDGYDFTAISIDKKLHSIRFYKNYLIYGSNEQRLTSKTNYNLNYMKSIDDFKKYFHKNPEYTWMNQDVMSNDYLPFIGKIKNNIYVATAYNTWGITNGTIAAKVIYDLLINKKNSYAVLFNPKRKNITLLINSFIGIFSYLKVYFMALFRKNNPSFIEINGIIYGVYKDKNGIKHKIKLICPHMKCNLVFNKVEKTWDCPCHGSRYSLDGKLIEGPSTKNLKNNCIKK